MARSERGSSYRCPVASLASTAFVIPFVALAVIAVLLFPFALEWALSHGFEYECRRCGHRFTPRLFAATFTVSKVLPSGGSKRLECSRCHALTWAAWVR